MNELTASTDLCDLLNSWDEVATKAIILYLKEHRLLYLSDRVVYEYSADFGVVRPLRNVWIKLLDLDSLEFVEFYEDVYHFRKTPRYEDIYITILISLACGLAVNALYDRYKEWREASDVNNKLHDKFSESGKKLYDYLRKIYATRESYILGNISYEKFSKIRDFLKIEIFQGKEKKDLKVEKDFTDIWNQHLKNHHLYPSLTHSIDEIKERIIFEHKKPSKVPKIHPDKIYPPGENNIILNSIAGSPGIAVGMIRVINSTSDIHKIYNGDIGVFTFATPDMVPGLRRCAGTIGLPECGGLSGHLAIVCRELGIPCVLQCNYDRFFDGQIVYLNGDEGQIQIIMSIDDIKKIINKMESVT